MVKRGVKIGRHFHLKAAREARRSSEVILGAAELACLAWDGLGFVVVSLPLSSHTHTTDKVRRRTTNMVDHSPETTAIIQTAAGGERLSTMTRTHMRYRVR